MISILYNNEIILYVSDEEAKTFYKDKQFMADTYKKMMLYYADQVNYKPRELGFMSIEENESRQIAQMYIDLCKSNGLSESEIKKELSAPLVGKVICIKKDEQFAKNYEEDYEDQCCEDYEEDENYNDDTSAECASMASFEIKEISEPVVVRFNNFTKMQSFLERLNKNMISETFIYSLGDNFLVTMPRIGKTFYLIDEFMLKEENIRLSYINEHGSYIGDGHLILSI